jgi:hypothetical protein
MSKDKFVQYTTVSYAGTQLLKKHKLDETGLWHIFGEDSNADFGGHHYQPDLGIVNGKLEDVIRYAVELKSFWQWGAGGDIKKIGHIPTITPETNAKKVELEKEIAALEAKIQERKNELENL